MADALASEDVCTNCGNQLKPNAKFCGSCGAKPKIARPETNVAAPLPTAPVEPNLDTARAPPPHQSILQQLHPDTLLPGIRGGKPIPIAIALAATLAVLAVLVVGGVLIYHAIKGGPARGAQSLPPGTIAFPIAVNQTLPTGPTASNVNVRSGPGVIFPSAEVLAPGSPIVEVGRANDSEGKSWIAIRRSDGSYGFIKERLLTSQIVQPPSAVATAGTQAMGNPSPSSQSQAAAARAAAYLAAWSSPFDPTGEAIRPYYAPNVNFFGSVLTANQIMAQKAAFAARWPSRLYALRAGSTATQCSDAQTCSVTGVIDWRAANPQAARNSSGVSSFAMTLQNGEIISESSKVIARQ